MPLVDGEEVGLVDVFADVAAANPDCGYVD
jgi:hypothetical protein